MIEYSEWRSKRKTKIFLSYYWYEGILTPAKCEEMIKIGKSYPKQTATTFANSTSEVRIA